MKNVWCWRGGRPWPPYRLAGGDARPTARRPAPPSYFHIKAYNAGNILFDNIRLYGYKKSMKKEAQLFKSLADETRLKMFWLLMNRDELCVCDIMGVLGITQSKASRHLRYLFHLGWVTDRREGVWMNYRLSVAPGSPEDKQLKLLADILSSRPEAQALKDRLDHWLAAKEQSHDGTVCQCS